MEEESCNRKAPYNCKKWIEEDKAAVKVKNDEDETNSIMESALSHLKDL